MFSSSGLSVIALLFGKKKELEENKKMTHAACLTECYFNTNGEILLCAQTLFFKVDKKKA